MVTPEEKQQLGQEIRQQMTSLGLKHFQVADAANVNYNVVTRWLAGKTQPGAIEYIKLKRFFKAEREKRKPK